MQEYKKVLVGTDGSETANLAFKRAIDFALQNNASLYIIHVVDTRASKPYEAFDQSVSNSMRIEADSILNQYEKQARDKGIQDVQTVLKYGSPKKTIPQVINEKGIDIVILGATGLNTFERFFIGSVSEYVVRRAECDVLIVRQ